MRLAVALVSRGGGFKGVFREDLFTFSIFVRDDPLKFVGSTKDENNLFLIDSSAPPPVQITA